MKITLKNFIDNCIPFNTDVKVINIPSKQVIHRFILTPLSSQLLNPNLFMGDYEIISVKAKSKNYLVIKIRKPAELEEKTT